MLCVGLSMAVPASGRGRYTIRQTLPETATDNRLLLITDSCAMVIHVVKKIQLPDLAIFSH